MHKDTCTRVKEQDEEKKTVEVVWGVKSVRVICNINFHCLLFQIPVSMVPVWNTHHRFTLAHKNT